MSNGVKLFRKDETQFQPGPNGIAAHGLINAGFSKQMGAGVGVFEKCSVRRAFINRGPACGFHW